MNDDDDDYFDGLSVDVERLLAAGLIATTCAVSLPKEVVDALCVALGTDINGMLIEVEIDATYFDEGAHVARARIVGRHFVTRGRPGAEVTTMQVDERLRQDIAVSWSVIDENDAFLSLFNVLRLAGLDPTLPCDAEQAFSCDPGVNGLAPHLFVFDRAVLRSLLAFSTTQCREHHEHVLHPVRNGLLLVAVPFFPSARGLLEHFRHFRPKRRMMSSDRVIMSDARRALEALVNEPGPEVIQGLLSGVSPPPFHPVGSFTSTRSESCNRPNDGRSDLDELVLAATCDPTMAKVQHLVDMASTGGSSYAFDLFAHAFSIHASGESPPRPTTWTLATILAVETTSIEGTHRHLKKKGLMAALRACLRAILSTYRLFNPA